MKNYPLRVKLSIALIALTVLGLLVVYPIEVGLIIFIIAVLVSIFVLIDFVANKIG